MERQIKKYGIYRHFKGKDYVVMGVSYPISDDDLHSKTKLFFDTIVVKHTENEALWGMMILVDSNGNFYHLNKSDTGKLVVYKSLYDGTGCYARPIDMFLSVVDKDKYPKTEQEYRMELITDSNT